MELAYKLEGVDRGLGSDQTLPNARVQPVRGDLYLNRLILTNFRSYERAEISPENHNVVLTGPNGAGKTNLLEAISFLAAGRGMRGSKLSDVTKMNAFGGWAVSAKLMTPDGMQELGTGLVPKLGAELGSADRRAARLNGENLARPSQFGEILQVAWLTPQMDRIFIEGISGRRKFFDRIVAAFHPAHSREVGAYERVMRERNKLLSEPRADASWLSALEGRMAQHGVAIAAARLDALFHLTAVIEENNSAFPKALLALDGGLEKGLRINPAVVVEEAFKRQLQENRLHDMRSGRAGAGPHKTDLLVRHAPKNMPAELCSTGEQKALLIGITLASSRMTAHHFGAPPLLLLDEVAAHLDRARRAALFDELSDIGSQIWLTGTDVSLFRDMLGRAMYFRVEDGLVTKE
jgi:DNA replication and repair protein RecF